MNEENGQPQEKRAKEKSDDACPPVSIIHTAESDEEGPQGTEQSKETTTLNHTSRWNRTKKWLSQITVAEAGMLLLTVAIAGSSIVYTKYAKRQWRVMRDQLPELHTSAQAAKDAADTSRDALVRSSRPWIGVVGIPVVLDLRPSPDNKLALVASMSMTVKNYGPSPALYVNVFPDTFIPVAMDSKGSLEETKEAEKAACTMASMSIAEHQSSTLIGDKMEAIVMPPFGQTIFPNEPTKVYFPSLQFNYRDAAELAKRTMRVVGCVAYSDQFSTKLNPVVHHTVFCYHTLGAVKTFTPSQGLTPCGISQNAD
jgi:hypothetical protein